MKRITTASLHATSNGETCPRQALADLGIAGAGDGLGNLPFLSGDATGGVENELMAVVQGPREAVDLPLAIVESNYHANLQKRLARGELPRKALQALQDYLSHNPSEVWEHSWVRLPLDSLCPQAAAMLEEDLRADKRDVHSPRRGDWEKFFCEHQGRRHLRVPVSYLLKLALAQAAGRQENLPPLLVDCAARLSGHYLSDNTSPETYSFHVSPLGRQTGMGQALGRETAKRFLLSSLLLCFAEGELGLAESGQRPSVFFGPHPPQRLRQLNACIPDSFYRELFMSPCLSGWDQGEVKHRYMHLCHQVLSRSQLNALAKLKEAGVIVNNLVVLPQTSNISLANNGTHVSLGSRLLSRALADPASGFGPAQEKAVGDLVIKFVEHFLPLFVGTYTAAPYRLDFEDFHPERALGFLPHQLDYTHLRMIWRRWRKKAHLKALGVRLTPFGPPWLDGLTARLFGLRGDLVPDFRLVDYLVAVLSTEQSPALDGRLGNLDRLKLDLAQSGVFDQGMAPYLPYRLREHARMGYSGFEGRHYSLFPSLRRDLSAAVDLQVLLTALACRLIARGELCHVDVPDDPQVESERRQIFFGAALDVPTFFVHQRSGNRLLWELVARAQRVRPSRRYPNYLRVHNLEYRRALLRYLRRQAQDICQAMGCPALLDDLEARLEIDEHAASQALTGAVLERLGARSALAVRARDFNQAAEDYYRLDLRRFHLQEGLAALGEDLASLAFRRAAQAPAFRLALSHTLGEAEPVRVAADLGRALLEDRLEHGHALRLINLLLISLAHDAAEAEAELARPNGPAREYSHEHLAASVH